MRIGIDIDDVVYDVYSKIVPMLCDYFGIDDDQFNLNNLDYCDTDDIDHRHYLVDSFIKVVNDFEVKENCVMVLQKLKKAGYEIIFITARSDGNLGDAYQVTKNNFDRDGIIYDKIIVNAKDKGQICMIEEINIFIDDAIKHTERVKLLGIDTVLFDMPYNKHIDIKRVENWNQIHDYIINKNK